jgi:AcrR family transcriptional regulator
MIDQDKLLEAAARVYGEMGFRGATTRRIAEEAGVNEITIFRRFGSKDRLIAEAIRCHAALSAVAKLPEVPENPERELTRWCAAHLQHLRASRALIRKTMGELEERPEMIPCVAAGPSGAAAELRDYMRRLEARGFLPPVPHGTRRHGVNPYAAGAMLMSALFADAMGRDMMTEMYPRPADDAPGMYVRVFLRALGCAMDGDHAGAAPKRKSGAGLARKRSPRADSSQ